MAVIRAKFLYELRDALNEGGVEYLFIGKAGAVIQGFPDCTQDADIFPSKSAGNGAKMVKALEAIGISPPAEIQADIAAGKAFIQMSGTFELDIVHEPDGIAGFQEAWDRGRLVDGFPVCSIADITASKRAAGRRKDVDAVRRLDAFRKYLEMEGIAPGTPLRGTKPGTQGRP